MSYDFLFRRAREQYLAETTKKSHLIIVSNKININQGDATMEENTDKTQPVACPLHKHGAFQDIYAAADLLALGANALKGIGAMMQPFLEEDDVQIDDVRRSDMAAIFKFFGEALQEPAGIAWEAAYRLERAAKGEIT